jgi:hypothetical protein
VRLPPPERTGRDHRQPRQPPCATRAQAAFFAQVAASGAVPDEFSFGTTHEKACRSAAGKKGARGSRSSVPSADARRHQRHAHGGAALGEHPPLRRLLAERASEADSLRDWLEAHRSAAVIPSSKAPSVPVPYNRRANRRRNVVGRLSCRFKNWRRIATRLTTASPPTTSSASLSSLRSPSGPGESPP